MDALKTADAHTHAALSALKVLLAALNAVKVGES